jgi:hypothetical protein
MSIYNHIKVERFIKLAVEVYDRCSLLLLAARLVQDGDSGSMPPTSLRPTSGDWPETLLLRTWMTATPWERANILYKLAPLAHAAAEARATEWVAKARRLDDIEAGYP